jgi:O-antigen/teichoic acid export membrane protein
MTAVQRILRDVAIVAGGQALTWVASFVFVLAQARFLGPATFGELSLALSYAAFFAIVVDFGVATFVTRAVAQAQSDERTILWSALAARGALWLIVMPAAWLLTVIFGYEAQLQATILILTDSLLFVGIVGALTAYFQGRERFALPAIANAIQKVAAATVGIAVLVAGAGLIGVAAVYAISAALAAVILFAGLRGSGLAAPRIRAGAVRNVLGSALPIGLYWIVGTFYFNVDMALIERLTPRESLGHYAAAFRLFTAASIVPAIVCGTVLYPMYSRLSGSSSAALRPAVEKTIAYLTLVGLFVTVIFVVLASSIVGLLYPLPAYGPAADALRMLAPGLLFLYVNSVLGSALFALHLERRLLKIATAAAVLNLVANLITIPIFGIAAAAAITSGTELFLLGALLFSAPRGLVGSMSAQFAVRAALAGGLTALALVPLAQAPVVIAAPLGAVIFAVACVLFQALPADDVQFALALVRARVFGRRPRLGDS